MANKDFEFMVTGGIPAAAGGPRQSAETGNARAETLGPDGGQQTWKPGPGGTEGPTDAKESPHNLFPLGMPKPGKGAGARRGGPRAMVAEARHAAQPAPGTAAGGRSIRGAASTIAQHGTLADNKDTRLYQVLAAGNATEHARPSAADAILMTSHVLAIDTTSAMFVTMGFFSAYTFANVPASDRADICKVVSIYMLIDVWFAGFLSIVSGSIFHLVRHTFRARDVALTAIEIALSLRSLDLSQDPEHWHSMNPTVWPVLCLFWGIMLTQLTLAGNDRLD